MAQTMTCAWMFVRDEGMALGDAIRLAALNLKLRMLLSRGRVAFAYRRAKDGAIRTAVGTLAGGVFDNISGTGRPTSAKCQVYFDVEANGFRSFRRANLVSVGEEVRHA